MHHVLHGGAAAAPSRESCRASGVSRESSASGVDVSSELCRTSWRQPEATHIVKYSKKETGHFSRGGDGLKILRVCGALHGTGRYAEA